MNKTVNERLADLREVMRRERLAAFIFPSTDPHQGEYTPDHWKGREFISGFNGSAGTAVVTLHSAALWTDSRYFLAAEQQLRCTEFQLMKLKLEGTPTIPQWINAQCTLANSPFTEVGIDGWCSSANSVNALIRDLRQEGGFTLRTNLDPLAHIWLDRPSIPTNPVEVYPMAYAGESAHEKIGRIRQALREQHADGMLVSALDDIAWTLNLRGTDVHCNPVFVAYLLLSSTAATLYVNPAKLSPDVVSYLRAEGVSVDDYSHVKQGLDDYFEYNILLDPDEVNYTLYHQVKSKSQRSTAAATAIVEAESPIKRMKTVKNATEIAGFKSAMLKDGIALVKFLKWLEESLEYRVESGELREESGEFLRPFGSKRPSAERATAMPSPGGEMTEISISEKLRELRAEQPLFRGISFDTIAGYGEHGAIVHYEATPETDIPLAPRGLLLLDSGAQYLDGTTDVTRTIALGPLTDEEKRVYTLVLKGHIQIELCKFPSGSSGTQIDILARKDMWREGLNYLHGTGHGVGTYLCVHEGPHQFRMEWKPAPLVAGMTITDEPGIYLPGRFGCRTENTLLIIPYKETEFGRFLQFEPLTLCPIDKTPIITSMLTNEERQWLDDYHQMVYERLSPHLNADEAAWLSEATAPLE